MRVFVTALLTLFILNSMVSRAQSLDRESSPLMLKELHVLKSNPLALVWSQIPFTGELRVMYERVASINQSIVISASYVFLSPIDVVQQAVHDWEDSLGINVRLNGYRVQLAYKFYLDDGVRAPFGFYLAPHASFNSLKIDVKGYPNDWAKVNFLNVNLLFGYQLQTGGNFVADFHIGAGYKNNFAQFSEGATLTTSELEIKKGFKPSLGINIGMAF
jgi:hypothetical protein